MSTKNPEREQTASDLEEKSHDPFEKAAAEGQKGIIREFTDFLKYNKKWWLVPILLVLGLIGVFLIIGASGGGAFIYTLF